MRYSQGVIRSSGTNGGKDPSVCTVEDLSMATRTTNPASEGAYTYSCQATELLRASSPLHWWDIRQYGRELTYGNIGLMEMSRVLFIGVLNWAYQKIRGRRLRPFMDTGLMVKSGTPLERLNLDPGEIVEVKNIKEILATLKEWKNRGLYYDENGEMIRYCGKKYKVLKQVRKVIDEKTGKLLTLNNPPVILEGVICCGHFSPDRLLCPRSLYSFWREIWLKRVAPEPESTGPGIPAR